MAKRNNRIDHKGVHERLFRKNKAALLKTTEVCALCGEKIDKKLRFPHPLSPSIDHIQPVAKGGHPSSIDNLQVAHLICNQLKGTKDTIQANKGINEQNKLISNRILPHSTDWLNYRG